MLTNELIYASATTLAHAIRDKTVSSEEVVNAYLERIEAVNPFLGLIAADGGAGMATALQMAGTTEVHPMLQGLLEALRPQAMSAAQFIGLWYGWDRWRSDLLAFMEPYEVILSPVCAYPAMPHGTTVQNLAAFSYVQTYTLTASPGVVVRAGTSAEGLPIGVQVVPRHWREDVALAVAQHIETALGGWQRPLL